MNQAMLASNDTRYAYAVGKIRVLEKRLLGAEEIERMVESQDVEGCLRILAGSYDYQEDVARIPASPSGGKEPRRFEEILFAQLERAYSLMRKLALDKNVIDSMLLRYDLLNVRSLMRAKESRKKPALIGLGAIGAESLSNAILNNDFSGMPQWLVAAIRQAQGAFEREHNPAALDAALDKAYYSYVLRELSNFEFLLGYFKIYIDLSNVKAYFRSRSLGFGVSSFEELLIPQGYINLRVFSRSYERPAGEFVKDLARYDYAKFLREPISRWERDNTSDALERACDAHLLEYASAAKYLAFGIEPLAGYILAKENEASILRSIIVGKLYGESQEEIRTRTRKAYV